MNEPVGTWGGRMKIQVDSYLTILNIYRITICIQRFQQSSLQYANVQNLLGTWS